MLYFPKNLELLWLYNGLVRAKCIKLDVAYHCSNYSNTSTEEVSTHELLINLQDLIVLLSSILHTHIDERSYEPLNSVFLRERIDRAVRGILKNQKATFDVLVCVTIDEFVKKAQKLLTENEALYEAETISIQYLYKEGLLYILLWDRDFIYATELNFKTQFFIDLCREMIKPFYNISSLNDFTHLIKYKGKPCLKIDPDLIKISDIHLSKKDTGDIVLHDNGNLSLDIIRCYHEVISFGN